MQRKNAGTSSWPRWISHFTGSFVGHSPSEMLCPPALSKRERTEGRKRKKFYIYLDVTHTHTPGRSRVNPERQKEEKSGHTRRAKGQDSAGGEGNERGKSCCSCGPFRTFENCVPTRVKPFGCLSMFSCKLFFSVAVTCE